MYIFFFNDTATTEIYTLSLHDALPICCCHLNFTNISKKYIIINSFLQEKIKGILQNCFLMRAKVKKSFYDNPPFFTFVII